MEKPNNIARVPCSLDKSFFRYWLMFLEPFHKLTKREIDVAASFVKQRYELSKVIKDSEILDRKNKVIVDGKINPKFIPNINADNDAFQLLLLFELK